MNATTIPTARCKQQRAGLLAWLVPFVMVVLGGLTVLRHAQAQSEAPMLRVEPGAHAAAIRRIAIDEQRGLVVTAADDKTARIWDLRSGELRHVLRPPIADGEVGRLYAASVHPSNGLVAVAGTTAVGRDGHRIYLFSVETGRMVRSFDARAGDIKRLLWTADGSLLAAGYAGADGVKFFDTQGRMVFEDNFRGAVYGLAIGRAGLLAATGADKSVRLYSATAGAVTALRTLSTQVAGSPRQGVAWSAAFSNDGRRLAVGFYGVAEPVRVYDVQTGQLLKEFGLPRMEDGNQWAVAWSRDDRQIYAAGRVHRRNLAFPVFRHDANSGEILQEQVVARDSISDLVALADGRVAWASQDGSWGVLGESGPMISSRANFGDFRGAQNLLASDDLRQVAWTNTESGLQKTFDFSSRTLRQSQSPNLSAPQTSTGFFSNDTFRDTYSPRIRGREVALDPVEVSRSMVVLRDRGHVVLGSSRALRRLDENGQVLWRMNTSAEVLALNASADSRLLLTAMSDGTLRWYRASDARHLLSLYPSTDGQWVVWTPNGYFDASAGADRLIGWSVNRGQETAADFYSLGRFRSRFQRADIIDQIFSTLEVSAAVQRADDLVAQARKASEEAAVGPAASTPAAPSAALSAAPPAPPSAPPSARPSAPHSVPPSVPPVAVAPAAAPLEVKASELPPALGLLESNIVRRSANSSMVVLPFTLRTTEAGSIVVEVRVNGRPVPADQISLPRSLDGRDRGVAQLAVLENDAVIQLIARNRFGVSEPLSFRIEPTVAVITPPSPVPTPPVTPPAAPVAVAPAPSPAAPVATPAPAPRVQPAATPRPRLVVLAIGISEYQRPEYRLGLAAKDARDFVKAMERQRGALYSEVSVRVLADRDATRVNIERGLTWLSASVGPSDIGMLFMAGHGLNEPGGQYYFLPYDGQHTRLPATSVAESVIRDTLGKMRGRALFFVDTCFAGNVVGSAPGALANTSRELGRLASELASSENGVVVFASSSGRQLSEEKDEWGNGAFTKALIDGIGGKADLTRTGRVTFKGLDFFVSEEVRRLTDGRQTPVTISPVGVPDFMLARI